MNTELVQSYISFKAPSPRNMLVLIDRSQILPTNGTISVLDREYNIINYDNDLQIRDMLEEYKDDMQGKRFCIISSKDDEENLMITDYMARSSCIEITPQLLLEYQQNGNTWFEDVNQLIGDDFWINFDRLQKFRGMSSDHISQLECESVILSALLNIDLSKPLLPIEAIELQRKLDRDEKIAEFRTKYPRLIESLERKVHDAIPLMAKIGSDDDLAKFLWLTHSLSQHSDNYELLLPRILGNDIWQKYGEISLERAEEICEQLIERDSSRSISQIKVVEEWLGQDEERMRIFKGWLGVGSGNVIKSAEYAAIERCFCSPMKDALKTVARAMVSSSLPMTIPQQLVNDIIKNITVNHVFLKDDSDYLRIQDTFRAFCNLYEFLNVINDIKKKDWWNYKDKRDNINLWLQEIYPKYLSRIELLRDRIETLNFKCDLLSSNLIQKITDDAKQILIAIGESFADLIQKYYSIWVMDIEKQRPNLTTDFIPKIFSPLFSKYIKEDNQSAYIIVFDGMRWDEWELLKPMILKTFHGKLAMEDVIPLISILPSTTEWARNALFAGAFPREFSSSDESELLSSALGIQEVIQIKTYGEAPGQRDNILRLLEDSSQIKTIVFNLIDIKIHSTMQNLVTLYEEVQVNFENTIQPYLEKIPSNSLVFILSDHGFVELSGKGIIAPDRNQADPHRRYIGLKSFSNPNGITPADFVFFSTENIKMPSDNILKYAFNKPGRFITSAKEQESGRSVRYAHGGVSMQEMIIPCAIFAPKSQGQLTMF